MPGWDIQPAGVRGVLGQTEGVASEFDGQMAAYNAAQQEAVGQSSSTIVAGALEGFAEAQRAGVGFVFVFARTGAAVSGAAQAVNAYVEGDLEMAANAQAAASAAPDPRAAMPGGGAGPR